MGGGSSIPVTSQLESCRVPLPQDCYLVGEANVRAHGQWERVPGEFPPPLLGAGDCSPQDHSGEQQGKWAGREDYQDAQGNLQEDANQGACNLLEQSPWSRPCHATLHIQPHDRTPPIHHSHRTPTTTPQPSSQTPSILTPRPHSSPGGGILHHLLGQSGGLSSLGRGAHR